MERFVRQWRATLSPALRPRGLNVRLRPTRRPLTNALGVEMIASLLEVTADTVRAICALQTTEEQERFVAPNAFIDSTGVF